MAANRPRVRAYYWLQSRLAQNLGDTLGQIVLEALGYRVISYQAQACRSVNPGRCLLPIGSVLWNRTFDAIAMPVDVWGCGWRGEPIRADLRERISFYAVRGPLTASGLGLPATTPLGDPALLIPRLKATVIERHDQALVIPHFARAGQMSAKQRCSLTGCDELLSAQVISTPTPGRRVSVQGLPAMVIAAARLGIRIRTSWQAIRHIAGAGFVLTGSLHGAILAQSYGVPWAAYDDGCIDTPPKWLDWAAYLGIQIEFVKTLAAGRRWWHSEGKRGTVRDLEPLLLAFPYVLEKAVAI